MRDMLFKNVKSYLNRALDDVHSRIDAIEKNGMAVRYLGTFKAGNIYNAGNLVTDHGSLWHCNSVTMERPPSTNWTLVVKRGRDAR